MAEIGQDILIAYYDNGVKDGQHSGYWKGINALHEAILYYLNMPVEEIRKVFNTNSTYDNLKYCGPSEFIEKIEHYKELYDLKYSVGDYVRDISGDLCVITNVDTEVHVMYSDGKTRKWPRHTKFSRTGSNAPLLLQELKVFQDYREELE